MNKKVTIIISCFLLVSLFFLVLFKFYNKKIEFDRLINKASTQILTEELKPYNTLSDEQKQARWEALITMISLGSVEAVDKLLDNIEFDPANDKSYELLSCAVEAEKNSGVLTELMIKKGLKDVNKVFLGGQSLLHFAAYDGNQEAAEVLIKNGADVNFIEVDSELGPSFKNTPLHISAQYGTWRVAKVLLENGADITLKNSSGFTPLECTWHSGDPDHESASGKRKVAALIREYMKKDTAPGAKGDLD